MSAPHWSVPPKWPSQLITSGDVLILSPSAPTRQDHLIPPCRLRHYTLRTRLRGGESPLYDTSTQTLGDTV